MQRAQDASDGRRGGRGGFRNKVSYINWRSSVDFFSIKWQDEYYESEGMWKTVIQSYLTYCAVICPKRLKKTQKIGQL
jgi:hypothetical protein